MGKTMKPYQNVMKAKRGRGHGSSFRGHAKQEQDPEFKPQCCQRRKKVNK
jgi:hypothetical protein